MKNAAATIVMGLLLGVVIAGFCLGPLWLEQTLGLVR